MTEAAADDTLLREMVREAERVIDHQIHAKEQLDAKSQSALTLAIAALGGGLALGSLVLTQLRWLLDSVFVMALASGGALNVLALVLALDAYAGILRHRDMTVGPSVGGMAWRSDRAGWALHDHLRALLANLADHHDQNAGRIWAAQQRHRYGLVLLVLAVGCYAISLLYMATAALET